MMKITINPNRPIEELVGENYGIVRMRLGNIHVMTSVKEQLRHARPKGMRRVPVALRRGWALCVLETISEYRSTYLHVMKGS